MRELFYTNYQSGNSGLSNGIMSIEIGVVLAFLTNRFLVLEGNVSPPANIVSYGGRVDNERPSRVTDLIDLPVPWGEANGQVADGGSLELTDRSLWDVALCFPASLDVSSADARSFAHTRKEWVTVTEEHDRIPRLRVSEAPVTRGTGLQRRNLSFYSYLFYLDQETRRAVYHLLQRMSSKKPFVELARRVAEDLGSFNAVHLRRGDFKVTYGVTTLERQPSEAIEALDPHFSRQDPLVILTDERDDPFFDEIKAAYPHHLFIDHHILDAYGADFDSLPHNDSLALAHLSQLVAAESRDFVGTMTSTFTSMVQRYRANRGREEFFKFLWNELPAEGEQPQRGRHPVNECVPLDRCIMVEERPGRYSWNRYNARINPAWMREWPESFLTPEVLATGALPNREATTSEATAVVTVATRAADSRCAYVTLENLSIAIRADSVDLGDRLAEVFCASTDATRGNVIAELVIECRPEGGHRLSRNGHTVLETGDSANLVKAVCSQLVPLFTHARRQHSWLRGVALVRDGQSIVITGELGDGDDNLPAALESVGWELVGDEAVPIRVADRMLLPFCRGSRLPSIAARGKTGPVGLTDLIVAARRPHTRDAITPLSPSIAVAELIGASMDFRIDRDRAVNRLCALVEQRHVAQLFFSDARRATDLLSDLNELIGGSQSPVGAAK